MILLQGMYLLLSTLRITNEGSKVFHEIYNKLSGLTDSALTGLALSPAWYMFTTHFSTFVGSKAVACVVFLWFLGLLSKMYVAISTDNYSWGSLRKEFNHLGVWMVWLLVCDAFRYFGLGLLSYPIESAIIIIEGGDIIKTISMSSSNKTVRSLGSDLNENLTTRALNALHIEPEEDKEEEKKNG